MDREDEGLRGAVRLWATPETGMHRTIHAHVYLEASRPNEKQGCKPGIKQIGCRPAVDYTSIQTLLVVFRIPSGCYIDFYELTVRHGYTYIVFVVTMSTPYRKPTNLSMSNPFLLSQQDSTLNR
jgi:hypothetical protein